MAAKDGVKMIVTIAERGNGSALAKYYEKQHVKCSFQCMGRGTASSELLDVLGVGSSEKDILISIAGKVAAERLLDRLDNVLQGNSFGNGIVFDIPVTGLNSIIATVLLNEQPEGNGGVHMDGKAENSLILVAVNQGHTDDVMDTAREAGARGGTVIRARWAGTEDTSQFYGISVHTEKELIAIVATAEKRNAIMEMVNLKHGLKTEAGAIILSVGIERMVRLA